MELVPVSAQQVRRVVFSWVCLLLKPHSFVLGSLRRELKLLPVVLALVGTDPKSKRPEIRTRKLF